MIPESKAFHAYIAPAQARSAWWRVLLGLVAIGVIWFGIGLGMIEATERGWLAPVGLDEMSLYSVSEEAWLLPPSGILLMLLTFIGMWLGVWFAVRIVHRRPFGTIFSPDSRVNRGDVLRGALLALGFILISLIVVLVTLGPPERTGVSLDLWAVWIVPIILGIVLQASAEEVLFRGYVLQSLAVWSRNPLVWALLPSLVFAALHYDPAMEPEMHLRMMAHMVSFGLLASALVWRTGNLGAAIGAHIANNIVAAGVLGIEGNALGFELWLLPPDALTQPFIIDLVVAALALIAVFLLFKPKETA